MTSADFLHDFALLIVAAAASLAVFRRLGQPPILGFLLAGVLISPFTFPGRFVQDAAAIQPLAEVGLVVLLFALGVELGWERIRRVGLRVVLIGVIEMTLMHAAGFGVGWLLGMGPVESLFLASALSFSSSAVIVRMLRDSAQLTSPRGQLVVGISVVEDFAAVAMLTVLTGVVTSTDGSLELLPLAVRLAVFIVAAVVIGTIAASKALDWVADLRSNEALLMAGLGLCFGLAIIGETLGLSAGAGAFLIGTVIGDSRHSASVQRMTAPVRDIFGAVFFVSIGMLVNVRDAAQFMGPALVVAGLAVGGKVLAATAGAFLVGEGGKRSIEVGTGLAQPGEFSLAIARAGAEHRSVGAALYPTVVIGTVFASITYPFVFRSSALIHEILDTYAPARWRAWAGRTTVSLNRIYRHTEAGGGRIGRVGGLLKVTAVNIGVIFLLIALGGGLAAAVVSFGRSFRVDVSLAHVVLAAIVITLSVAPGVVVWKAVSQVINEAAPWLREAGIASRKRLLYELTQRGAVAIVLVAGSVLSAPWVLSLMRVDELRTPGQLLAAVASVAIAATVALKIHSALESTFHLTLLGEGAREPDGDQRRDR